MNPIIELFRGIAAWMVLTSHYAFFFSQERTALNFLWTGVDFFFVISGFIFTKAIYAKQFKMTPYLIRRFFRIYPLYVFSLILYYFATADHPEKNLFFIRHLFFLQTTDSLAETYFFNPAYWSLPVEIEYYFFLPILAFFAKNRYFTVTLVVISLLLRGLITSFSSELSHPNLFTILQFHLPGMLLEFVVGIVLYICYEYYEHKPLPVIIKFSIFTIGISLLSVLSSFYISYGDQGIQQNFLLRAYYNFFCAVSYATIIFTLLLIRWKMPVHFLVFCFFMGNISYGIYLFHNLFTHIFKRIDYHPTGFFDYIICLLITSTIALFFYHVLENPLRKWGRNLAKKMGY